MNSETFAESRIESDCHKRDSINGHSLTQSSRKRLVKKDSQFKITAPNCKVLQHLVRPAAMVAVPTALTEEDTPETRESDDVQHVAILTAEKEEALWWHMDALRTSAPDNCAKEAMFHMTIDPNCKDGGDCVTFQSYLMDQYLIIVEDQDNHPDSNQPTQPQFKFKLSSDRDEGVTSTFILGTAAPDDDPNYRFLRFQNPKDKQWYYWYVDGGEVSIRKERESEVFKPVVNKDC